MNPPKPAGDALAVASFHHALVRRHYTHRRRDPEQVVALSLSTRAGQRQRRSVKLRVPKWAQAEEHFLQTTAYFSNPRCTLLARQHPADYSSGVSLQTHFVTTQLEFTTAELFTILLGGRPTPSDATLTRTRAAEDQLTTSERVSIRAPYVGFLLSMRHRSNDTFGYLGAPTPSNT